jgi:site-specific DNA-methyltransferase (adenine-specific)
MLKKIDGGLREMFANSMTQEEKVNLILGNSLDKLKELEDNSIDSIVTDPPYGLSFMGKKWDYDVPSQEIWEECLRVLKPGGYLLAFAGTRTQHRMAVRIEDAGFEIRDMIAWVYGSGFPKSHNIGKAVDKLQGNERVVEEREPFGREGRKTSGKAKFGVEGWDTKPTMQFTKGTSEWEGWGTALKPALEPITVARKPFKGSVAQNVLKWGTGGINIDGCRVEATKEDVEGLFRTPSRGGKPGEFNSCGVIQSKPSSLGRFPANLITDGSDEVVGLFPKTGKGNGKGAYNYAGTEYNNKDTSMFNGDKPEAPSNFNDSGSASRFFYCAKASKSERNKGLEGFENNAPPYESHRANYANTKGIDNPRAGAGRSGGDNRNNHPTVKPISLMRYLVRLVTPKNGTVLDPFMGSGTTGISAKLEGFDFIGIEREEEYIKIAEARIKTWEKNNKLL